MTPTDIGGYRLLASRAACAFFRLIRIDKLHRRLHIRMQALFDRAGFGRGFQFGSVRGGYRSAFGKDHPGLEGADATDRVSGHFLDHLDLEAVNVEVTALRH